MQIDPVIFLDLIPARHRKEDEPAPATQIVRDRPFAFDVFARDWSSRYISRCRIPNTIDATKAYEMRNDFLTLDLSAGKHFNNPHRKQAAGRKSADDILNAFITRHGYKVYSESLSDRDIKQGYDGSRLYYGSKDLHMPYKCDPITSNHVVKMIDVDYYVSADRIARMVANAAAVVMYTHLPRQVAHFSSDPGKPHGWTLVGKTFTGHYAVGSSYVHELWDWERDVLEFDIPTDMLGWNTLRTVCNVHHRFFSEGRAAVLLIPKARIHYNTLASYTLSGFVESLPPLAKLESQHHGEGVYSLIRGDVASIFQNGTGLVYTMSTANFFDCAAAARAKNVSIATLETILGEKNQYHLRNMFKLVESRTDMMPRYTGIGSDPRSYVPLRTDLPHDEERVPGQVVSKPIVDASFVPGQNAAADDVTVQERIENVRADPMKPVDLRYRIYAVEWLQLLQKHVTPNGVHPLSQEDVLNSVSGSKVRDYLTAFDEQLPPKMRNRSFQKSESYPNIKPPRNISNVDKRHVVRYLRYILAISKVLKTKTKWYMFGRLPEEVCDRLCEIANSAPTLNETDFSKFDGTLSRFLRMVELSSYLVLITGGSGGNNHEELERLFNSELYQEFRTRYKIWYNCGTGRCSGSGGTSCGNTVVNAFLCYCVMRECALSPENSWERLGGYGGDDGVTSFPDDDKVEPTMSDLQIKVKSLVRKPGGVVSFLGRHYLDLWSEQTSHHDILRAASKIHYSTSSTNTPRELVAWRKAVSLYVTDSKTPVIGDWAKRVLEIIDGGKWEQTFQTSTLGIPYEHDDKLCSQTILSAWKDPIYPGPDRNQRQEILADFLQDSPVDLEDYKVWLAQLRSAKTLDEFPDPLWTVAADNDAPISAVVDDRVVGPPMEPSKPKICKAYEAGKCTRGSKCKLDHPKGKEKEDAPTSARAGGKGKKSGGVQKKSVPPAKGPRNSEKRSGLRVNFDSSSSSNPRSKNPRD